MVKTGLQMNAVELLKTKTIYAVIITTIERNLK